MAKPLSPKSKIIREAIKKHPHLGNTELAAFLNDSQDRLDDKLEFAATEVAQQKQALKKAAEKPAHVAETAPAGETDQAGPETVASETAAPQAAEPARNGPVVKKRGRPPGRKSTVAPAAAARTTPAPKQVSAADVLDRVFALAEECGGIKQLKRVVDRLAER